MTVSESQSERAAGGLPARGLSHRWRWARCGGAAGEGRESDGEIRGLANALRVSPLVARLMMNRGLGTADAARAFLEPALTDLHDPSRLSGAVRAAERLVRAVRDREPIVIYGDYDVDGVTATAILYHTLKALDGAAEVRRYVPHRIEEGYGISDQAVGQLIDGGARVIVSVDCGVTAVGPARVAAERGVDLIITDHHEAPLELPGAYAIVHPGLKRAGEEGYPFEHLCGAGVAYKLAWQVARCWCGSERVSGVLRELLVNLLPLAALGTIADVVPLVGENRVIASYGLRAIKKTPWAGLNALIDAARLREDSIDAYHVGFVLGPRLNAVGRMGHAKEAIRLLTDAGEEEARKIAGSLTALNEQRQAEERRVFKEAREMAVEMGFEEVSKRVIVLAGRGWHGGVVGIVASRMVERFGRPTVLLCVDEMTGEAAGSARSIEGYALHEALQACSEHLVSHGGHAMAAGLRMRADRVEGFREAMLAHAGERIGEDELVPTLEIEAEAELTELTVTAVGQMERLAPFGRGNATPVVLVRGLRVARPAMLMGREGRHLSVQLEKHGAMVRAVGWNMARLSGVLTAGRVVDVAGEVKLNRYRGNTTVEVVIRDLCVGGS